MLIMLPQTLLRVLLQHLFEIEYIRIAWNILIMALLELEFSLEPLLSRQVLINTLQVL